MCVMQFCWWQWAQTMHLFGWIKTGMLLLVDKNTNRIELSLVGFLNSVQPYHNATNPNNFWLGFVSKCCPKLCLVKNNTLRNNVWWLQDATISWTVAKNFSLLSNKIKSVEWNPISNECQFQQPDKPMAAHRALIRVMTTTQLPSY